MPHAASVSDLLYTLLAVQLGLISLDEAHEVLQASESGPTKNLRAQLLQDRKLSQAQDELVAQLVDAYLAVHDGEVEKSLTLFQETPAGRSLLGPPESHHGEATVSLDGSKTSPRPAVHQQAAAWHQTKAGERFRKIKFYAAGGLGEISLARDEQLRRTVALKQLKETFADDPQKRERFVLEGEITGALEHPGIVPVYALGVDVLGRPFYAMRLIRGDSFREAVLAWQQEEPEVSRYRRESLTMRRLLARFVGVCQAIEYAHSRGVIHRDIKPANIMLGAFGETYVVDWGMARVLGDVTPERPLSVEETVVLPRLSSETQFGSVVGTPAYMSPEQAAGRLTEVGTRSDVYSLGATLYFMLTGRAPFIDADENPLTFISRVIQGRFPPPREVQSQIPRELNAICCRAMAVNVGDRYDSPTALAAEVERYLADESVVACNPTIVERLARWTRKHRSAVVAGGVGVTTVAIVSLVSAFVINEFRQREQRTAQENLRLAESEELAHQQADQRFLQARETVDTWLTGYSEALQGVPVAGVQSVRARMLELAAQQYETFAAEKSADPSLQLEQGRTLMRLGSIYRLLGRPEKAAASLQAAQDALQKLFGVPEVQREAVRSWALSRGVSALIHADGGDHNKADAEFAEAIAELEKLGPPEQAAVDYRPPLVTLWTNRGGVLAKVGAYEEAEKAFERAISLGQAVVKDRAIDQKPREAVAIAQIGAGQVKLVRGDATGAGQFFQSAAQVFAFQDPHEELTAEHLQLLVSSLTYLATAERQLGNVPEERDAYVKAAEAAAELCRVQPEAPGHRIRLAMTKNDLGQLMLEQLDAKGAEPLLKEASELATRVVSEHPSIPEYREVRAAALDNLAQATLVLGRWSDSVGLADKAATELKGLRQAFPDIREYMIRAAVAESTAAQSQLFSGDRKGALQRFTSAVELIGPPGQQQSATAADRQIAATIFSRYGEALRKEQDPAASAQFARAADEWKAALSASTDSQFTQGAAWFLVTCPDPERQDAARALELAATFRPHSEFNPRLRLTLAVVDAIAGRPEECLKEIEKLPPDLAAAQVFEFPAALALEAQGKNQLAAEAWHRAASWADVNMPGNWDIIALKELAEARLNSLAKTPDTTPGGDVKKSD